MIDPKALLVELEEALEIAEEEERPILIGLIQTLSNGIARDKEQASDWSGIDLTKPVTVGVSL